MQATSCFSHITSLKNVNWSQKNEFCPDDHYQPSERLLAEPKVEQATTLPLDRDRRLLVTSTFSFSHIIFKRLIEQTHEMNFENK